MYGNLLLDLLQVIAGCLSEDEIKGLKEMFKSIDKDNSGTITLEELKSGLAKQGTKLSDNEIQQLMEAVSLSSDNANSIFDMYTNYLLIRFPGRCRREWVDRLRGVRHRDGAHEQNGQGGAPLHGIPVLRQGQQRVS
jgi:uncharacterized protein YneF (UPF0154 family)